MEDFNKELQELLKVLKELNKDQKILVGAGEELIDKIKDKIENGNI